MFYFFFCIAIEAKGKLTKTERERLFEGGHEDPKPRTRTPEEIMAAYRGKEVTEVFHFLKLFGSLFLPFALYRTP